MNTCLIFFKTQTIDGPKITTHNIRKCWTRRTCKNVSCLGFIEIIKFPLCKISVFVHILLTSTGSIAKRLFNLTYDSFLSMVTLSESLWRLHFHRRYRANDLRYNLIANSPVFVAIVWLSWINLNNVTSVPFFLFISEVLNLK